MLLLILVYLFFKDGGSVPVSHPLNPRTSVDSCHDINHCRKLFDIIWGCLATIFACTWVSVHPNVPPPGLSRLARLWRRLKMMLVGILAPEIMVGFAGRQFFSARELSKEFGFTKMHGFFFCMGGFVSPAGCPIVTREQLEDQELGPQFLKAIKDVNAEDIMDKSKGDVLSKGVALLQGLWFITQCIVRMHQHLAVTELEVATLAFAVVNIFIWLLWWNKPLDVQRPIVVVSAGTAGAKFTISKPSSLVFRVIFGYSNKDYDPLSSTSVPPFWSLPMDGTLNLGCIGITALVGFVFGAIHCTAWNTDFATTAEMRLWRSCSSVIATIPALSATLLFFQVGPITYEINGSLFEETVFGRAFFRTLEIGFGGAVPIYILARLILVTLPLIALRSLPPSAFVNVNWSVYIPHL
ncbi:hypothetical protein B0H12DRAFT_1087541 [Mycena haematopus]|nr:hypothetical protein B0H12DRAFT_1087541 [Mycena haematopus]